MPDTQIHFFEHSLMKYPWIIIIYFFFKSTILWLAYGILEFSAAGGIHKEHKFRVTYKM